MSGEPRLPEYSDDELAFGRRVEAHLATGLKALCVPLALSCIVLANGNRLSRMIDVSPESLLFRLWPFNQIYLRQFANSPYDDSEIKWFFAVVSCSNLIWLGFLCWKIASEVFRRDVQFPLGQIPWVTKSFLYIPIVGLFVVAIGGAVGMAGFSPDGYRLYDVTFSQSIASGAFKIVIFEMTGLYIGVAFILEYGGLGVRYWLSRKFGYFVVGASGPHKG